MAETRKLGRPSFSPTRKEAFRKDSNMSKKMFRDKKRKERDEALSTVVPPTAPRYKHIRISTATFWRWRSLAQELGLEGDEQMASFLLNTYYERAVEAASKEQRQDIPQNSEESRQNVETSMFQGDEQGTETDAMGSTTLPMQATQDGWRGDDGDKSHKTNDGGEMLEGEFTCLVKTEPHDSGEESNEHGTLPSVSQQGDSLTGDDDDRKEIEEVEFKCLIKEEPDDGERNQPSCSKQGGNSSVQSICEDIRKNEGMSGDTSCDRSHVHGQSAGTSAVSDQLAEDITTQSVYGGNSSKQSSCQEIGNTQIMSGDTSHDRSHGKHLPGDYPLPAVLGTPSHSSPRGHRSNGNSSVLSICEDIRKNEEMSGDTSCDRSHAHGLSSANSASRSDQGELTEDVMTQYVCGGNVGKQSSCQQKGNTQIISGDSSHDRSHGKHLPGDYPLQGTPSNSSPRGNCSSWDSRKQSSYQRKAQETSGTSHEEHPPQDFPIQAFLGNHSDLSTGGNYSCGDSRGQSSHQKESTLKMSLDTSGDTSHDRPHGDHLPEDFPILAVLGNVSELSTRGSYSSEYDSHPIPNQADYSQWQSATDSATMSDDHEEERLDLKTDNAMGLGENCETASSKQKSSQISSTRTEQSNPCINSAGEQLFTCTVCQKGYNRKHNLYRHMRLHSEERPHECTYCKKRFWQSSELKRHLRIHTGQKPYLCSVCDKRFRDTSNLKAHMAAHVRKRRKHQCSFCDEGFPTRNLRDAHSASAHPSEKPYCCTECDMRFCRRGSLQAHIWRTHTARDKPHVCSICNKAFSHLCFLTIHKRIHTGEKPYECPVCGDRFSFHTQLADHKAKHTGVKPYSCSICEKRFWRNSCLNRHQRTHTKEKPFQCPECGKCFTEKSSLIKHLNTHPL
ncbi:zinc finger protein 69-like isoform X2 [Lytechinus pictus]|uniref:zinc finger protein 69-like isoform X2 n=1 Tax=Lytechinus pictus TaxID=7653 RepID=UPI0030BA2150